MKKAAVMGLVVVSLLASVSVKTLAQENDDLCGSLNDCRQKLVEMRIDNIRLQVELTKLQAADMIRREKSRLPQFNNLPDVEKEACDVADSSVHE